MKAPTKAYKLAEFDRIKAERDRLDTALHLLLTTTPDAVERFRESDDSPNVYTYHLFGVDRYDGGIVLTIFRAPGQKDQGRLLGHLDDLGRNHVTEFCNRETVVLDKLRAARYRILNPQVERAS